MVERGGESCFATESLRRLAGIGAFRRNNLDGYDAFEGRFDAFVDDGHAAAAELFFDSVVVAELFLDHREELIAAGLHDDRGYPTRSARGSGGSDCSSGWC